VLSCNALSPLIKFPQADTYYRCARPYLGCFCSPYSQPGWCCVINVMTFRSNRSKRDVRCESSTVEGPRERWDKAAPDDDDRVSPRDRPGRSCSAAASLRAATKRRREGHDDAPCGHGCGPQSRLVHTRCARCTASRRRPAHQLHHDSLASSALLLQACRAVPPTSASCPRTKQR
jgi:hypothetical protein